MCQQFRLETWRPDFSTSAQASPIWTRLACGDHELANSLEWAEWSENPVQVILCDACGHQQCASGGYVHVSRLDDLVLWTSAQDGDGSMRETWETLGVIRRRGALAIPIEEWNGFALAMPLVPAADRLVAANCDAVADAWVLGPARPEPQRLLRYLEERLIGGDTLDRGTAIALVAENLEMLSRDRKAPFRGSIRSVSGVRGRIETLYFDGPRELDWPALAFVGDEVFIALDRSRIAKVCT